MTKRNYYDVLGVKRGANTAEIKKAFRQKARKLHPDQNPGDQKIADEFKEINEAYEVLKDAKKKAAYDDKLGNADFDDGLGGGWSHKQAGSDSDFSDESEDNDHFEEVFSFPDPPKRKTHRALWITLEEAYNGIQAKIQTRVPEFGLNCYDCNGSGRSEQAFTRPVTCGRCGGQGMVRDKQVLPCSTCKGRRQLKGNYCTRCNGGGFDYCWEDINIPAGVSHGAEICLEGMGPGYRSELGDLYAQILVEEHETFDRDGDDLFCCISVPENIATLGGEKEITLLDGSQVRVNVPAGAQDGMELRLRGKGMPNQQQTGKWGDLYVEVSIDTTEEK